MAVYLKCALKRRWLLAAASLTALVLALVIALHCASLNQGGAEELKCFRSYNELKAYLERNASPYFDSCHTLPVAVVGFAGSKVPVFYVSLSSSVSPLKRSYTNLQVEGVDEADIVKVQGPFIYIASHGTLYAVKAYPPVEASIAYVLEYNGTVKGVYAGGDRLIVIVEEWPRSIYKWPMPPSTTVFIYDLSSDDRPLLAQVKVTGRYVTSRVIDHYLYLVTSYPALAFYPAHSEEPILPAVNGQVVPATEIKYIEGGAGFEFTTLLSIDLVSGEYSREAFLLGPSSYVYVSPSNLYLLCVKMRRAPLTSPLKGITLFTYERTLIYRFSLNGLKISLKARGEVPGRVLDQFSTDEEGGFFRVATTTWGVKGYTSNNLYVLDMDLKVVGSLEGLAPGERIYAARYLGNVAFLVTFRRMDPLFAVDLSDPAKPKVIGYLESLGYSEYLHPYGEHYLIGIGVDTDELGVFKGLKVSLYDVSNLSDVREVSCLKLERFYYTPVLNDHKALTLNLEEGWFALPVEGLLRKGVLLVEVADEELKERGFAEHEDALRAAFIEDYVYTVSPSMVKVFTSDLKLVRTVPLVDGVTP
ncbi:MAG: hypothetical protein DRJ97_04105 [Thermoprotei archaeon]|nr:MAG: hypothetical protein DRJ97_04105 [Thermoprotei archaeon]